MLRLVEAINPDTVGIRTNHGAMYRDEHFGSVDSRHLVVYFQNVVFRNRQVSIDEEAVRTSGDGTFSDFNEVGKSVGCAVAWTHPLGVQHGDDGKK